MIVDFCSESPRDMEELVYEINTLISAQKTKIRALVRLLEQTGVLKNIGSERHNRWVASNSRWGRPTPVSSVE
jgi:hypothetical protein